MKSLSIINIFVVFLTFSTNTSAEVCAKLEFAELDSIPKDELLKMRCKYNQDFLTLGAIGDFNNRCAEEITHMDRILIKKYELTPKGTGLYNITSDESKANDLGEQLIDMCNEINHSK